MPSLSQGPDFQEVSTFVSVRFDARIQRVWLRGVLCGLLLLLTLGGFLPCQAKEKAALAPMGVLGPISEAEQRIVFSSLQESLSAHYLLASQKSFEVALEQAFQELDYEECTEDQCFALIQQILQVDNLFLFNLTREEEFTQLSLTRVDRDSQRLVKTAICQECNIAELNAQVGGLVAKIVEEDLDRVTEAPPPVEQPARVERPSTNFLWQLAAVSLTLASALQASEETQAHNELVSRNRELSTEYSDSSSSRQASIRSEFDGNTQEIERHKTNAQTFVALTLLFLSWEAYLLMASENDSATANLSSGGWMPSSLLQSAGAPFEAVVMRWKWRF